MLCHLRIQLVLGFHRDNFFPNFFLVCLALKLGEGVYCRLYIFTVQIPSWPTGGGITLEQATERCRGMLQLSAAATTCSPLVGTLTLDVSLESCLEDILVSGWRERKGYFTT